MPFGFLLEVAKILRPELLHLLPEKFLDIGGFGHLTDFPYFPFGLFVQGQKKIVVFE